MRKARARACCHFFPLASPFSLLLFFSLFFHVYIPAHYRVEGGYSFCSKLLVKAVLCGRVCRVCAGL